MEISIDFHAVYGAIPLESFRQISSELEILATKEIPHNERAKTLVKDSTVRKRIIKVKSFSPARFWYAVEDYAIDERDELFSIGSAEYDSKELR